MFDVKRILSRQRKHKRASQNRTLILEENDVLALRKKLRIFPSEDTPLALEEILDQTILGDTFQLLDRFPNHSVDLVFVDPPYNLEKDFHGNRFQKMKLGDYQTWLESWVQKLVRLLKPHASFYLCGDYRSSGAIWNVLHQYFTIQNRITWEREKGRGAKRNWKNCAEDIWFCTLSNNYIFNVDDVKLKRRVIAPYRDQSGAPKDWACNDQGTAYRLTHPSNMWTDITVPFWSMPENTDHPTQKPEKLVAKIILASSQLGDVVLDPFLGSGTTSVVAKKLGRHYIGIEQEPYYALLTEKRLELAEKDPGIQGYRDGVFLERNAVFNERNA